MATERTMQCPACRGEKKLIGMFPVYAESVPAEDRKPVVEIDCPRCDGRGTVSEAMMDWIVQGKYLKAQRLNDGMGLREFCVTHGVSALVRSRRERGCVDPSTPDEPYEWPAENASEEGS